MYAAVEFPKRFSSQIEEVEFRAKGADLNVQILEGLEFLKFGVGDSHDFEGFKCAFFLGSWS